jgi:hypothetical protein
MIQNIDQVQNIWEHVFVDKLEVSESKREREKEEREGNNIKDNI